MGGKETEHSMPWMVFVMAGIMKCGGSLINNQFVLTAAHCFCTRISKIYNFEGKCLILSVDTVGCNRHMDDLDVDEDLARTSYKLNVVVQSILIV